jgi:predicted RND superfamily exporter protein
MNTGSDNGPPAQSLIWLAYLRAPWVVLVVCGLILGLAGSYLKDFRFDASSDTLVVEGDADLAQYEEVAEVFGGDDFLFLTFEPNSRKPITPEALETLGSIVQGIRDIEGVSSVFSILDAPLLKSPPIPLDDLLNGIPTLQSPETDFALAQKELSESPFFRELLITSDGTATAMKIDLASNLELERIQARMDELKDTGVTSGANWEAIRSDYLVTKEVHRQQREKLIADIRQVRSQYQDAGTLHLGGVPMIAADMITYVKSDLSVFSGAVIVLIVIALWTFFRRLRWVVLPIATAALGVVYTVGFLGFLEWQATVISSNFISLLGITTVSLIIHLIVQYRELLITQPDMDHVAMVYETMRSKFAPCFYTAITTIAAFGSLTVSGILPVEYFGWMMCIGIIISFLVTFTFFPAVMLLLPKGQPGSNLMTPNNAIRGLGQIVNWNPWLVTCLGVLMAVVAYFGIARVSLDNRFAEYFDTDTEIYQGMYYLDTKLGGTIPFDVVLKFPTFEDQAYVPDDEFEEDIFATEEEDEYPERYWFTRDKLDTLEGMHRFLESKAQVGKVLSLTALEDFARDFTDGQKLTTLEIVAILSAIPEDLHSEIIAPFANPTTGQMRLTGRIVESGPSFDREEFRQEIQDYATGELSFSDEEVVVSGMMVLFNSMLSQLLNSQISTLSYILSVVFVMFLILLRSLPLALLGMIPNTLAAATVIGAMGWAGIPLDMMTTTIAAVCIGIGVDDTIHYLHRFREEYARWGDPRIAVSFSHESIGRALYYTSFTVVAGFSVLCFSNFVPTVLFGLWTAIAMLLALFANLTLLPALLVLTHAKRNVEPQLREGVEIEG